MTKLHPLSDFIPPGSIVDDGPPSYWYEGLCPQTKNLLRLPRTPLVEALAFGLMRHVATDGSACRQGKMYGLLLVQTPSGEQGVLQAFSGLFNEIKEAERWVPPIPGKEKLLLAESQTLARLQVIKQELMALEQMPEQLIYQTLQQEWDQRLEQLTLKHKKNKRERQEQRQKWQETFSGLGDEISWQLALKKLEAQSQREGRERRTLKQQKHEALQPLQKIIAQAQQRSQQLKRERRALSRQLQEQMYAAYSLTNFAGTSASLQQLMGDRLLPTGTGECCAPKLLHYAATHQLTPLAMAEFWWGESDGHKVQGHFYGACAERCQPLMGFLLSGLSGKKRNINNLVESLELVYEDQYLLLVNKSTGILSVPGRSLDNQDSVLSRLRYHLGMELRAVHRLDRETSGLLLIAKDLSTYRHLSQQFQQRRIYKVYEALVVGNVPGEQGRLSLPLWGDPHNRPYQRVDWQRGKPSITDFVVRQREGDLTRVVFFPQTGRTHQIRVHAASPQGLGTPILGDRLYNSSDSEAGRLYLHAKEIKFTHPQLEQELCFQVKTPF